MRNTIVAHFTLAALVLAVMASGALSAVTDTGHQHRTVVRLAGDDMTWSAIPAAPSAL
jgi:hypothetical protein